MPVQAASARFRMRATRRAKGKRGGARAHYLYLAAHGVIYLLFVYGKDEQSTLSRNQKRQLKAMVESIKREWSAQ